jgi:hypothetical protein
VVACHVCFFDLISKRKTLVKLEFENKINMVYFCIKQGIVIIEELLNNNNICLHFYNLITGEQLNCFEENVILSSMIVDIKLSIDASRMLIQCANKKWTLSMWSFENKKQLCTTNVIEDEYHSGYTVNGISFYPNDKNKILVIGMCTLITYKIANKRFFIDWKTVLVGNLLSHAWLNSNDVLIGDDAGRILFFNVFIKNFNNDISKTSAYQEPLNSQTKSVNKPTRQVDEFCSQLNELKINKLLRLKNGFLCLVENRYIYIYEKNGSEYDTRCSIKIPVDNCTGRVFFDK